MKSIHRAISLAHALMAILFACAALMLIIKAVHEAPAHMLYAASIVLSAGVLLAGWGVFGRMNRYAGELEPEAMAEAKREDRKLA